MEEIWKDIKGYEGLYQVSNMGRVKSLERTVWNGKGYYKTPERILKAGANGDGYLSVNLCKDGRKKPYYVHRLVVQAFIENTQNLPEINHKNEDKTDNRVENLEWCNRSYNVEYSKAKPVIGINKVSGLIVEFPSAKEAKKVLNIAQGSICDCCKGKRNSAGGYIWFYAD